jgi:hypothetical protein
MTTRVKFIVPGLERKSKPRTLKTKKMKNAVNLAPGRTRSVVADLEDIIEAANRNCNRKHYKLHTEVCIAIGALPVCHCFPAREWIITLTFNSTKEKDALLPVIIPLFAQYNCTPIKHVAPSPQKFFPVQERAVVVRTLKEFNSICSMLDKHCGVGRWRLYNAKGIRKRINYYEATKDNVRIKNLTWFPDSNLPIPEVLIMTDRDDVDLEKLLFVVALKGSKT